MNRITLTIGIIFLLTSLSINTNAQLNAGFKVGGNMANYVGQDVNEESMPRLGLNAGAFVRLNLTSYFGIQPEVSYTMKGRNLDLTYLAIEYTQTDKLNYLNVPVLLRTNFGDEMQVFLNAGPSFNFLINSDSEYEIISGDDSVDLEDIFGEVETNYTSPEIGLIFGAGIQNNSLLLDFRYEFGMQPVIDSDDAPDMKNSVFTLSLGYVIN